MACCWSGLIPPSILPMWPPSEMPSRKSFCMTPILSLASFHLNCLFAACSHKDMHMWLQQHTKTVCSIWLLGALACAVPIWCHHCFSSSPSSSSSSSSSSSTLPLMSSGFPIAEPPHHELGPHINLCTFGLQEVLEEGRDPALSSCTQAAVHCCGSLSRDRHRRLCCALPYGKLLLCTCHATAAFRTSA